MVGHMGKLTRDGLCYRVRLGADQDDAIEIVRFQWVYGCEKAIPAFIPAMQHFGSCVLVVHELGIALSRGFFPVGGQKVGPAREHVAMQMLHDHRYGVGAGCRCSEEVRVVELRKSLVAKAAIVGELLADALEEG